MVLKSSFYPSCLMFVGSFVGISFHITRFAAVEQYCQRSSPPTLKKLRKDSVSNSKSHPIRAQTNPSAVCHNTIIVGVIVK